MKKLLIKKKKKVLIYKKISGLTKAEEEKQPHITYCLHKMLN